MDHYEPTIENSKAIDGACTNSLFMLRCIKILTERGIRLFQLFRQNNFVLFWLPCHTTAEVKTGKIEIANESPNEK